MKDLWTELKVVKDSVKRVEIQKEINGIETWMIKNKIGTITEITDWNKSKIDYGNDFEKRFNNPNYPQKSGAVFVEDMELVEKLRQD